MNEEQATHINNNNVVNHIINKSNNYNKPIVITVEGKVIEVIVPQLL